MPTKDRGGDNFLVDIDKNRKVATITFNRPERLNAFNMTELGKIGDLVHDIQWDDNIKVIVFKGLGRAFGVGDDISTFSEEYGLRDEVGKPVRARTSQRIRFEADENFWGPRGMIQQIFHCPKATIAQAHGYCYGGHFYLAQACDITIAAEGTYFSHPGFRYMGPSAGGDLVFMMLNLGLKRTMGLAFTGKPFTAEQALDWGEINAVVPQDKLEQEVARWADAIALLSLDGIVCGKYATRMTVERLGFGGILPVIAHNLGTNVKWDKDDFNMIKLVANLGHKQMFREREKRYAHLKMDLDTVKAEYEAIKKLKNKKGG